MRDMYCAACVVLHDDNTRWRVAVTSIHETLFCQEHARDTGFADGVRNVAYLKATGEYKRP